MILSVFFLDNVFAGAAVLIDATVKKIPLLQEELLSAKKCSICILSGFHLTFQKDLRVFLNKNNVNLINKSRPPCGKRKFFTLECLKRPYTVLVLPFHVTEKHQICILY